MIPLARAVPVLVLLAPVPGAADCERGLISGEVTYDGDTIELGVIA